VVRRQIRCSLLPLAGEGAGRRMRALLRWRTKVALTPALSRKRERGTSCELRGAARVFPSPACGRQNGRMAVLHGGAARRVSAMDGANARAGRRMRALFEMANQGCPHPNPLPQAGEGERRERSGHPKSCGGMSHRRGQQTFNPAPRVVARKHNAPLPLQGFAYRFSPYQCRVAAIARVRVRGASGTRARRSGFSKPINALPR
jgi:hypothetical protein